MSKCTLDQLLVAVVIPPFNFNLFCLSVFPCSASRVCVGSMAPAWVYMKTTSHTTTSATTADTLQVGSLPVCRTKELLVYRFASVG